MGSFSDLVAEFEIQDGEKLVFEIEVIVNKKATVDIRFHQQFYRE